MKHKIGIGKRLLSFALALGMVIAVLPPMNLLQNVRAASTVEVDTMPVYSDYVFSMIREKYVNNMEYTGSYEPATVYASMAILYAYDRDEGDTTTHVYHNSNFVSSKANLRPPVEVIGLNGNSWNAQFKLFDSRLNAAFANEDVKMHFGGTFTSTKNNKPTMTVGGVSIGSNMAKKSTQKLEGVVDPSGVIDTIHVKGGSGTYINGMWAALIDDSTAIPKTSDITASMSGDYLMVEIPMDEDLRWANENAGSYADQMWIEVVLTNELTDVESTAIRLNFREIAQYYKYDALRFGASLSSEWTNGHFSISRITKTNIPTVTGINFEVYGMLGCYDRQSGVDGYGRAVYTVLGNASRKIMDVSLNTTPITDIAGNKVDLSNLTNLNLKNRNLVFDNLAPTITKISVAAADGVDRSDSTNSGITEGSQEDWPADIDRRELLVGAGQSLTFTALTSEEVKTSGVSAKLNVQDKDGRQVVLNLKSTETVSGTLYSETNSTKLTFEAFTAAAGMTMMSGYEGKSIQIIELNGTIQDTAGNNRTGTIPAADERLFLDVQPPVVSVQKIEGSVANTNTLELQITVSDKNAAMNAGILDQELKLWVMGTATQALKYQYTLDTYPNPFSAKTGSGTLGAQKSGDPISYTLRALDEATLKLTLTFDERAVVAVEDITVHAEISDIVGNRITNDYAVTYELDQVPPTLTVGAVRYDLGVSSAMVTIPVSAADAHNQIAKLEYQWTTGSAPTSWETAAITQGASASFNVTKTYNDGENHAEVLWVRATDSNGLTSEVKSVAVKVDLTMPSTSYSVATDTTVPNTKPVVTVNGPAARTADAADAYTRITVTIGNSTYVRVVKTGESINVFDFDGTWYQVAKDNTRFTSVTEVTDISVLKSYYGPVTVTFENAYVDLTPVANEAIAPNGAGYFADTVQVNVLYAPDQSTPVHTLTWDSYNDAQGSVIEGTGAIGFGQTMTGVRIDFTLSNALQEDWGLTDIDFDKSYVEFKKVEGDTVTVMVRNGLQAAMTQSFSVPYLTDAGESFTTGIYQLTVHVVKRDGRTDSFTAPRNLVLDADTVRNEGVWGYSLKDATEANTAVSKTAEDSPFDSFGMAMGVKQEIYRDDVFAHYTNGVSQMTITLAADEDQATYDGITVGEVAGFRLWPLLSNLTAEEVDSLAFHAPTSHENGQASYSPTFGACLVDAASYPQGGTGVPQSGGELNLVMGTNTICYQVKMENGSISPVRQFTIFVTDELPVLEMSVDSVIPSMILSEIEGQTNVQNIVMKVDSAFSMNGSGEVTLTMLTYGNTALVNGVEAADGTALYVDDLITLSEDTYSGGYTENLDRTTKTLFVLRDEFGGTAVIAPQIGAQYRIDGDYAVNYDAYPTNPWTDTQYGIRYNEPQYDSEGNITGYVTSDLGDNKLGVDRTTAASLDYNRYAINTETVRLSGAGYTVNNYYIRHSHDVAYGSYIDWNSVTLTLPTLDGGTVTLPMDYSGPNDAGFISAEYDADRNEFVVLIAKPVNDEKAGEEAFGYTNFSVKFNDTVGNPYTFAGGYRLPYVSSQPSGSIGKNGYTLRMPTAVLSAAPIDVECTYSSYASSYWWEINTGLYNAGTYSGTYTDMFGITHAFNVEMETWEEGLDITVSPTTPTGGPVTVVLKSTKDEAITVETDRDGQTITGNGTTEVTVTVTENGSVVYETDTIYQRLVEVANIVGPGLKILWSYDEETVPTDDNGTAYHYGPVTAYLISGDDSVDVVDNYTGETPSYTFYPGEATSYTFKASDFTATVGSTVLDCEDVTVTLQVELRTVEQPPADGNPDLPEETADTNAPAVQLRAYTQRNGLFADEQKALQVEPGFYADTMTDYTGDTIYVSNSDSADTAEYVSALGWASTFRFQVETQDDSKVKLFIKDTLYAQAPAYASGTSDTIEGVSLNGRVLEVSAPVEFTLFVVDSEGNATAIPMAISNVGEAPVPRIQKIPGPQVIYAYLLLPEGVAEGEVADLKLTYPNDVAQATQGDYSGCWYAPLDTNGIHTLNYSYTYKGENIVGKLEVEVTELDTTPIELQKDGIIWSANKQHLMTNQDVTVQLHFTKNVSSVQVPAAYVDSMEVLITGKRVTVRYPANTDAVVMTVVATNGTGMHLTLDAVTNIDKTAPAVRVEKQVLSENGKSVTVHFNADEPALLRELGSYGTDNGDGTYSYTRLVETNGSYCVYFIDQAGNIAELKYQVTAIVDTPLRLLFNTSGSDDGAVTDPEGIQLSVGDTVYVKANRDSTISMNGGQLQNAAADTWISFTITESEAGLWPIIHAQDAFGNTAAGQFGSVKLPDRAAPVLALKQEVVVAKAGTERSEILKLLEENLIATDMDPNVTVNITFTNDMDAQGTTSVTYTATDSAGNEASITGWLRLTSVGEPDVRINGQTVDRDSIYLAKDGKLELTVDVNGEPYSVVWKKGVKTVGQMKIGTTDLLRNESTIQAVELPFHESGYYTVCVKTQGRDEYRIIVYVE